MFKHILADKNGTPVSTATGLDGNPTLIAESNRILTAHWQSTSITTATTTTIIEAKPNQSIMLTDLVLILSKKIADATIIPRFTDGTNTINFFAFDGATASFQYSHAFQGGVRGWKNADLQIVTNKTTTVGVLIGYVHIATDETKPYGEWDKER